jgi:molecular chaperone GrpE
MSDTTKTNDPSKAAGAADAGEAKSDKTGDTSATSATSAGEAVQAKSAAQSAEARELERQLDDLRQKLKEAETRAQENLDRWQRAQADLANYRRRAQFEREEMEKFGVASLVATLLPVLDNFDRAWQTLPGTMRRLTWLSGVDMINRQLHATLQRIGLAEIEANGQPFDPALHEAVDRAEAEGAPHVVEVLQAGYKLHERVLRPALVKVGPKPATPDAGSDATSSASAAPESTAATVAPEGAEDQRG